MCLQMDVQKGLREKSVMCNQVIGTQLIIAAVNFPAVLHSSLGTRVKNILIMPRERRKKHMQEMVNTYKYICFILFIYPPTHGSKPKLNTLLIACMI